MFHFLIKYKNKDINFSEKIFHYKYITVFEYYYYFLNKFLKDLSFFQNVINFSRNFKYYFPHY